MIPDLILDMRDETFATEGELTSLIHGKLAECGREDGTCLPRQIVITPHQEKLLKLELAEQFVFRWKNLKGKSLTHIGTVPVMLAEPDALICGEYGRIHD